MDYDYSFKTVVVGDSSVGKSSFLIRLTDNYFHEVHITTIGVDFKVKSIETGTHRIKAIIWDTAGSERFRAIGSSFYRGAQCIIIAFSLTDRRSFENVIRWAQESEARGGHNATKLLIGTKSDLVDERKVEHKEARVLAERLDMLYAETSSKTGDQVEECFVALMSEELDKHVGSAKLQHPNTGGVIVLNQTGSEVTGGWCTSCYGTT